MVKPDAPARNRLISQINVTTSARLALPVHHEAIRGAHYLLSLSTADASHLPTRRLLAARDILPASVHADFVPTIPPTARHYHKQSAWLENGLSASTVIRLTILEGALSDNESACEFMDGVRKFFVSPVQSRSNIHFP